MFYQGVRGGGGLPSGESVAPPWTVNCQRPMLLEVHCTGLALILHSSSHKRCIYHSGLPPFLHLTGSLLSSFSAGCWTRSWAPPFVPILISPPTPAPAIFYCVFPPPVLPEIVLAVLSNIWLRSSLRSSLWPFLEAFTLFAPSLRRNPLHWAVAAQNGWNHYHNIDLRMFADVHMYHDVTTFYKITHNFIHYNLGLSRVRKKWRNSLTFLNCWICLTNGPNLKIYSGSVTAKPREKQ